MSPPDPRPAPDADDDARTPEPEDLLYRAIAQLRGKVARLERACLDTELLTPEDFAAAEQAIAAGVQVDTSVGWLADALARGDVEPDTDTLHRGMARREARLRAAVQDQDARHA